MLLRSFTVALLVAFTCACSAAAQSLRFDEVGCSVEVPPGWVAMPQAELDALNALAAQAGGERVVYGGGFRRDGAESGCPYFLIQVRAKPIRARSFEQIERQLGATSVDEMLDSKTKDALSGVLRDVRAFQPRLDRERLCLYTIMSMTEVSGVDLKCLTAMQLAKRGQLFVHFYSEAAAFETDAPLCQAVLNGVRVDAGEEFQLAGFNWMFIVAGAFVGGVVGPIVSRRAKRKAAL